MVLLELSHHEGEQRRPVLADPIYCLDDGVPLFGKPVGSVQNERRCQSFPGREMSGEARDVACLSALVQ